MKMQREDSRSESVPWRRLKLRALVLALLGTIQLFPQVVLPRWKSWPVKKVSYGKPPSPGPLGHWLKLIEWRTETGKQGRFVFQALGLEKDGYVSTLALDVELAQARIPTVRFANPIKDAYPLISVLETDFKRMDIGDWTLWSSEVAGTTNGDPPNYHLLLVEDRSNGSIAIAHGLGRGLMGFHQEPGRLELLLLSQGGNGPSVQILRWAFKRTPEGLISEVLPPRHLFMLDGAAAGIIKDSEKEASEAGLAFYTRSIESLSKRGGIADAALPNVPRPIPYTLFPGWIRLQDHYVTGFWSDFNWVWDLAWYQGPARNMVVPDPSPIPFRWAKNIHVFQGMEPFDPYESNVGPKKACQLSGQPGWGVVLVKDKKVGAVAVGIVSPECRKSVQQ